MQGGELVILWNIVEKHVNRLSWNFQDMSEMTQGEMIGGHFSLISSAYWISIFGWILQTK